MSTRSQREKSSRNAQHTAVLSELLREEANRYCADCGAKGPRWASWNIGCFLCIRCAGIHRNLGVHISRVKSVNLDSWTPEQLKSIQEWGNRRCKAYFECHLPDDFRRPQTDSAMESFIRNKYERKQYINKNGPPPKVTNTTKETPSVSKPLKEAKIERPKKERKKDDASSSISSKNAKLPAAPVVVSKETGGSLTSVAKPRPHPQKSDVINSKCEPPSADLLSLDHPVTVGQQTYSNSASKSSVQELIDFGGFQGHDAALGQVNQASAFVAQEETEKSLLKDDSKSTKDSIMALYKGTGGQQPQMFGVPGGMYVFPQQNAQPQQQQLITNSYGTMASGFQQQAVPGAIPQYAAPQQAQQVSQIQQQLQHMHMNNQIPIQKPSFVSQHTFNQQATASTWAPQRPVSFSQQPVQYAASSKTAPTTNSAYGINMYQVGGTHVPTGQTLSHSLWQ